MEKKISLADCDLTVIPCEGYTRDMYWDETGMGFILPSPNMPTWEAALLYTGTVWFEGPTINEGRGTTKAFELISAPYIDPIDLAQRMNELELPGVQFRPASITVYSGNQTTGANYTNELSHGVLIHITDKRACSPIQMQTALFLMLQAMYGRHRRSGIQYAQFRGYPCGRELGPRGDPGLPQGRHQRAGHGKDQRDAGPHGRRGAGLSRHP